MFTRRTVICAILCALLTSALAGGAPAGASNKTRLAGALAQQRYYASYGTVEPVSPSRSVAAAKAQGRYYASFGEPRPLTVLPSREPSGGTPWLPVALVVAAALAVIAAGGTLARRLHLRRRFSGVAA